MDESSDGDDVVEDRGAVGGEVDESSDGGDVVEDRGAVGGEEGLGVGSDDGDMGARITGDDDEGRVGFAVG